MGKTSETLSVSAGDTSFVVGLGLARLAIPRRLGSTWFPYPKHLGLAWLS